MLFWLTKDKVLACESTALAGPEAVFCKVKQYLSLLFSSCLLFVGLTSCSMIDEDLSGCGEDFKMEYQLKLVTNMTTEMQTVLSTEYDLPLQTELKNELSHIFTDYARGVNLSFYGTDSLRHQHEMHVMNANEASYTIYLPVEEYMHLALANLEQQHQVTFENQERANLAFLDQLPVDTVDSHETGIFTARQHMQVLGNQSQTFNVRLYMANCAAALVVDTTGYHIRNMSVYIDDLADGFFIRDSVYTYRRQTSVRTFPVTVDQLNLTTRAENIENYRQVCYCGVGFPSRRRPIDGDDGETYWRVKAYFTLDNGKITENVFHIHEPLLAGNLKIIRCRLTADGAVEVTTPNVGVSVTLNWKPGGTYNPEV